MKFIAVMLLLFGFTVLLMSCGAMAMMPQGAGYATSEQWQGVFVAWIMIFFGIYLFRLGNTPEDS